MTLRDLVILGCSAQQPTRKRNHGAYLLRWNEEGLLFDPGEGTQRQFIFANIAPTAVTRIFVTHFHGDHCLGLGSMLMRLNLDRVTHPIHCYYPASGKKYFDRLRYGTIYHEHIKVIEHPISEEGVVYRDERFCIETAFLHHGVDNLAYRVIEPDKLKFNKDKLEQSQIRGLDIRELIQKGFVSINGKKIYLEEVSWIQKGDVFAIIMDTKYCKAAVEIAKDATMLLCESTYLEEHRVLADKYQHLTAKQAALIAKEANVGQLVLSHFSARYLDLKPFEEEARQVFPNILVGEDLKKFDFLRKPDLHRSLS